MTCRIHRNLPPDTADALHRALLDSADHVYDIEPEHPPWPSTYSPPDKGSWRSIILAMLVSVAACGMMVYACSAPASELVLVHMHDRPDLDQWLKTLYSKQRGPCCDSTEAETMADPDWRNASEMKKGECTPSQGGMTVGETIYCVRLENPDKAGDWKWWTVPDGAIVELPNKAGPALIWLIWNNRGTPEVQPYIRCFLPGTLS